MAFINGGVPTNIKNNKVAAANKSASSPLYYVIILSLFPLFTSSHITNISGQIYGSVPTKEFNKFYFMLFVILFFILVAVDVKSIENPKSHNFRLNYSSSKRFSSFISLWQIFKLWQYSRAFKS